MPDLIRCQCTRINDPWRRFCGGCGSQLAHACADCGFTNSRNDRFCGGCGHKIGAGSYVAPSPVRVGSIKQLFTSLTQGTEAPKAKDEPTTMPIEIFEEINS